MDWPEGPISSAESLKAEDLSRERCGRGGAVRERCSVARAEGGGRGREPVAVGSL